MTGEELTKMRWEPVGYKFDTSINKPVLMKRCGDYYYAYPTLAGWVYYRSRYLGERDTEIVDIDFVDWAYEVLNCVRREEYKKLNDKISSKIKQAYDNGKKDGEEEEIC